MNSKKCFFLGYETGTKGYRLWDPTARKVVISRDVVFNEEFVQDDKSEVVQMYFGQEDEQENEILENPRAVSDQPSTSQSQVEDTVQTNRERPRRIITTPTRLNDYVETYKPHANVVCTYACIAEEHETVHYHEACESVNTSH
jgi:hypothetical protein